MFEMFLFWLIWLYNVSNEKFIFIINKNFFFSNINAFLHVFTFILLFFLRVIAVDYNLFFQIKKSYLLNSFVVTAILHFHFFSFFILIIFNISLMTYTRMKNMSTFLIKFQNFLLFSNTTKGINLNNIIICNNLTYYLQAYFFYLCIKYSNYVTFKNKLNKWYIWWKIDLSWPESIYEQWMTDFPNFFKIQLTILSNNENIQKWWYKFRS
jgi:hypothetical protein